MFDYKAAEAAMSPEELEVWHLMDHGRCAKVDEIIKAAAAHLAGIEEAHIPEPARCNSSTDEEAAQAAGEAGGPVVRQPEADAISPDWWSSSTSGSPGSSLASPAVSRGSGGKENAPYQRSGKGLARLALGPRFDRLQLEDTNAEGKQDGRCRRMPAAEQRSHRPLQARERQRQLAAQRGHAAAAPAAAPQQVQQFADEEQWQADEGEEEEEQEQEQERAAGLPRQRCLPGQMPGRSSRGSGCCNGHSRRTAQRAGQDQEASGPAEEEDERRVIDCTFYESEEDDEEEEDEAPVTPGDLAALRAVLQRQCLQLGSDDVAACTAALLLPDGCRLTVPLRARQAAAQYQGLELPRHQHPMKLGLPRERVVTAALEKTGVALVSGSEMWLNSRNSNAQHLISLAYRGFHGSHLRPTALQFKSRLYDQVMPAASTADTGIRQGGGWVGGLSSVNCAVFRGVQGAGSGEAVALLARHSSALGARKPGHVARVAALCSAAARAQMRELQALLCDPDPHTYAELECIVREVVGSETWQELEAQAVLQLLVVEVDFHGRLAAPLAGEGAALAASPDAGQDVPVAAPGPEQDAVARRMLMWSVPKPPATVAAAAATGHDATKEGQQQAQEQVAAGARVATRSAAAPGSKAATRGAVGPDSRPSLVWGNVQVLTGEQKPGLPAFAAADPQPGTTTRRGRQRKSKCKAMLSCAVGSGR